MPWFLITTKWLITLHCPALENNSTIPPEKIGELEAIYRISSAGCVCFSVLLFQFPHHGYFSTALCFLHVIWQSEDLRLKCEICVSLEKRKASDSISSQQVIKSVCSTEVFLWASGDPSGGLIGHSFFLNAHTSVYTCHWRAESAKFCIHTTSHNPLKKEPRCQREGTPPVNFSKKNSGRDTEKKDLETSATEKDTSISASRGS